MWEDSIRTSEAPLVMTESRNIFDKLKAGAYTNKIPYHTRKENLVGYAAYCLEDARIAKEFSDDCLYYMEKMGVPAQYWHKLYAIAWEDGHAHGFSEVAIKLDILVGVFQ